MIEADGDVEILDKERLHRTVSEGGKLDMEMRLKRGRGYISADKNFDADLGIGFIPSTPFTRRCASELPRRSRSSRSDHRLRQADPRSLDQRRVLPADALGLAAKLLKDHMTSSSTSKRRSKPVRRRRRPMPAPQREPQPLR
jgi:DNA-directed RNA polymerase subunit alpha